MERLIFTWQPGISTCEWMLLDRNGNRQGPIVRGAELAGLPAAAAGREIVWLVPGAEVLSVRTNLPVRGRDRLVRALPYALEERFAEDPERMFFALPGQTPAGETHALALDADWLREALATLAATGIAPRWVVPDYLALPWTQGSWTALADAGVLYVRSGAVLGFALEADAGWPLLERQFDGLPEVERPARITLLLGREPHGPVPALPALEAEREPVPEGLLGTARTAFAEQIPINLLQGSFNPRTQWRSALRPWLPAAGTLAAVLLFALTGFVAGWIRDVRQETRLHQAVLSEFRQVVPDVPMEDLRGQVRQRLQRLSAGTNQGSLLSLLAALARANTGSARIESLGYQVGTLQVQLHAQDVSTLESLRSDIASHGGFKVTIHSANQTKSGVEGSLSITRSSSR